MDGLRKVWIQASHNNPWIFCSFHGVRRPKGAKRGFAIAMAPSRKERTPGIAVHERLKRVALRARVHIEPETGSMQYTCTNSLHNVSRELSLLYCCVKTILTVTDGQ